MEEKIDPTITKAMDKLAKELKRRQVEDKSIQTELMNTLLSSGTIKGRYEAEAKCESLEEQLKASDRRVRQLEEENKRLESTIKSTREALKCSDGEAVEDRAKQVFDALASAQPDHPAVGGKVPGATVTRTDVRFIYACLEFAAERLGRMGCNDWGLKNPDEAHLAFMSRVEDYVCEDDKQHERTKLVRGRDGVVYGSSNFLVPLYLQDLLRKVHGKDIFEGTDALLFRFE
jgi:hypothetical protein